MNITINEQNLTLHYTGAIYWQEKDILMISDVHLGKVSHFRKHGVAVPENSVNKNFERLNTAMDFFNPTSVIFLGDLFHSKKNNEWDLFDQWVRDCSRQIVLVAGNHDIIAQHHYDAIGVKVCMEMAIGDFLLTHHPEERKGLFNFCGHIHPAVLLHGSGKQTLKLPCFFKKQNQLILPAFGEFTGTYFMVPEENDCVYALANEEVILVC